MLIEPKQFVIPTFAEYLITKRAVLLTILIAMDIPSGLVNKVLNYLLRQADAGDTEAEELLDELNELNESVQAEKELKSR